MTDLQRLQQCMDQLLQQKRQQLASGAEQLQALSPLQVLARGYALCQDETGRLLRRADEVAVGETITVVLEQGRLSAAVTGREE